MIIYADRLLSGDSKKSLKGNAVYIKDGIIKAIGEFDEIKTAYPEEKIEKYPGTTLMPGMIDLHIHPGFPVNTDYLNPHNGVAMRALQAAGMMQKTLLSGVTTVRDCGSPDGLATAIKKISSEKIIKAPRLIASLSAIAITGGHGVTEGIDTVVEADGVDEIKKAVRKNLKNGADCIKLMDSEGYRGQEFNQDELNAAVEEAHRFGAKVAVHAGYGESMEMCIKAGVDSIEHGTHLSVEQAIEMKNKNITWVPTVYVFNYTYQSLLAAKGSVLAEFFMKHKKYLEDSINTYKDNLKKLYDTGVRICTGTDTDCTSYKGASPVAGECEYLVEYGLKPIEAIECATKNGADYLGLGDSLGQIKEGYIADIILVKGNPVDDIGVIKEIVTVYQSGEKV